MLLFTRLITSWGLRSERVLLGLAVFLLSSTPGWHDELYAQNALLDVQKYTVEEGLSHRNINSVYQDSTGYIWIATEDGLNRFDGHRVMRFDKGRNGLVAKNVLDILGDQNQMLWLMHGSTVNNSVTAITLFDPKKAQGEAFESIFPDLPFDPSNLAGYLELPDRSLVFTTTDQKLIHYSLSQGFRVVDLPTQYIFEPQFADDQGRIWGIALMAHDQQQLLQIDLFGNLLQRFSHDEQKFRLVPGGFDPNGNFWYTCFHGQKWENTSLYYIQPDGERYLYDHTDWELEKVGLSLDVKISFGAMPSFFVGKQEFLFGFHIGESFLLVQPKKKLAVDLLLDYPELQYYNDVFIDKAGNYWLSTRFGLFRLSFKDQIFKNYLTTSGDDLATKIECRGIAKDADGLLHINSYRGRWVVNEKTGTVSALPLVEFDEQTNPKYLGLPHSVLIEKSGRIWYGEEFPISYDPVLNRYERYHFPHQKNQERPRPHLWSSLEDEKGRIWFGGEQLLLCKEKEADRFTTITTQNKILNSSVIYHIYEDSIGLLWLLTNRGLFQFEPSQKKVLAAFNASQSEPHYLPATDFRHLHVDKEGVFWLATGNSGLVRWDRTQGLVRQINRYDGLSSNTLHAVYEDEYQRLWISSDNGLMQLDKNTMWVRSFLPKDGLPHHEFNRISHYQAPDGRLYFGGLNGITSFHPDDFADTSTVHSADLVVTRLQQYRSEEGMIDQTNQFVTQDLIQFRPNDRYAQLDVALLNFEKDRNNLYAWKLEPLEDEWNYQREPVIKLNQLPYGSFKLKIKAQGNNGQWSAKALNIPVLVKRPYYQQPGFIILLAILLILVLFAYIRWRTWQHRITQKRLQLAISEATAQIKQDKQTIEKQATELQMTDELKSRFFVNASHEIRTPLSLIVGPVGTILNRGRLDNQDHALLKKVQQNIRELQKLVNEMLDLSKLESGKLALEEQAVFLFDLLRRVTTFFELTAERKNIQLQFEYKADRYLKVMVDKGKLEKILINLLGNALKFTPEGGKVLLYAEDKGAELLFSVWDNGPGIHTEDLPLIFNRFYQSRHPKMLDQVGTGVGLALSKEYASVMNGKLWVESPNNFSADVKGSTFYLSVPRKEFFGKLEVPTSSSGETGKSQAVQDELNDEAKPKAGISGNIPHILVAEDHESLRAYLVDILSTRYEVHGVAHGKEALAYLANAKKTVNLILSDVMMPEMDGFELLQQIRKKEEQEHCSFIMLTAKAASKDRLHALRIGADDYLIKPFEEEELLLRIQRLLENQEARIVAYESEKQSDEQFERDSDQELYEVLRSFVEENLSNADLSTDMLARQINVGKRQLQRKLKLITGLSPIHFIRDIRLQNARQLLESGTYPTVAEVAYRVGFTDPSYFSRLYRKHYGKYPSELL